MDDGTPNIGRIAREGMMFTDYYAEQSCTAGQSSFLTGQVTLRTGLVKAGEPAAPSGLRKADATIVELLKPLGYATGLFGIKCVATGTDDATAAEAMDFIARQARVNKPFFCWFTGTRVQVSDSRHNSSGPMAMPENAGGMAEHDGHVGLLLKKLDDLGIANDTIVISTMDHGPQGKCRPSAATAMIPNEKSSTSEGAFRAPCMIRWPE
jgi:arylsulfatase A-like enzyme